MFTKLDRNALFGKLSPFYHLSCPKFECYLPYVIRQISSFVERVRHSQTLKESENLPDVCYKNGSFIVFIQKPRKVLVHKIVTPNKTKQFRLSQEKYRVMADIGIDVKENSVFLGLDSDAVCQFALEIPGEDSAVEKLGNSTGRFLGVRKSLFLLSRAESALTSQACSLLSWHKQKVFCYNCGHLLVTVGSSGSKFCKSESCSNQKETRHHPPINPVGISIVSDESHSKVLLVRQPSHLPGMFTCIAGFIEVGESVEDNVRREVAEEVGLDVTKVEYVASQHWAFPASRLMLGCHAIVKSADEKISLDTDELEDAEWFTPDQLRESLLRVKKLGDKDRGSSLFSGSEDASSTFRWVPPEGALANTLISWWLEKFHA